MDMVGPWNPRCQFSQDPSWVALVLVTKRGGLAGFVMPGSVTEITSMCRQPRGRAVTASTGPAGRVGGRLWLPLSSLLPSGLWHSFERGLESLSAAGVLWHSLHSSCPGLAPLDCLLCLRHCPAKSCFAQLSSGSSREASIGATGTARDPPKLPILRDRVD